MLVSLCHSTEDYFTIISLLLLLVYTFNLVVKTICTKIPKVLKLSCKICCNKLLLRRILIYWCSNNFYLFLIWKYISSLYQKVAVFVLFYPFVVTYSRLHNFHALSVAYHLPICSHSFLCGWFIHGSLLQLAFCVDVHSSVNSLLIVLLHFFTAFNHFLMHCIFFPSLAFTTKNLKSTHWPCDMTFV